MLLTAATFTGEFTDSIATPLAPGSSGTASFNVIDEGPGDVAGTGTVQFFLETSPAPGNGDIPVGSVTAPISLESVTYYLIAEINADQDIQTGDTADNIVAGTSFQLVSKLTQPTVTRADPADIDDGTALSAVQLDATANVPGTFAYTPAAGVAGCIPPV